MKRDFVDDLLDQWATERPGTEVSSLGVVVRIQALAKLLQQRTDRALKAHGLKHWEYDVLSVLRRQGAPFELPVTEIATAALLTSGAMTTRIDGLEKRGLVRRVQSKLDRRSMLVRLTKRGIALVDKAIDTRLSDSTDALAAMTTDDRRQLAAALRNLIIEIDGPN